MNKNMELLLHWMRKQEIDDKMLWKKAAEKQEVFLRDDICMNLLHTHAFVVSTHTSKSIKLPVYAFLMHNGIKVICRENFYGWKLSVVLPKKRPVANIIPEDLFEDGYNKDIPSCYFEGFKNRWVYSGYNPEDKNQTKFSFGVYSDYDFYMVMYFLKHLYGDMSLTKEINKLTRDDVIKTISTIYMNNGYNEIREVFDNGYVSREMSGWEIMWRTYHQLDDYDFRKKYNLDYTKMDICDNIGEFADEILKYPEVSKAFVLEKKMYEMEF